MFIEKMKDIDLDVPRTDVWTLDKTKKRELKLANKLNVVEEKLKKVYFFTKEQIYDVFNKNTDHDWYFFEQIIRDVEQQYAKIPMGISVNEYLYTTLMSIENLDLEQRKQDIITTVGDILDGQNTRLLSYMDFIPSGTFSQDDAWKNMKEYVKNDVQDFFVIHIDEDVAIDTNNKKDKERITSKLIQHYISRSRMSGINFFVFVQKNGMKRIAIWVQKWSTWTTNDEYFGDLAEKYTATKVNIPLSKFIKTSDSE